MISRGRFPNLSCNYKILVSTILVFKMNYYFVFDRIHSSKQHSIQCIHILLVNCFFHVCVRVQCAIRTETLFLSSNRLQGTIPSGIVSMSKVLKGLYLSDNYFHGTMPSQIGGITSLEALFLDTNKLSGSIPDSFGNLQHLKQLYLFQNNLTGTVPTSLKNLNHLSK